MSDRLRVLPYIGGETKDFPNATISPLVSLMERRLSAKTIFPPRNCPL